MAISLQRIDQLHKPDSFDDSLNAASVAGIEGAAVDYADFQEGILSQIKRILYADTAGNWHDNPGAVGGADGSLVALAARTNPDNKLILKWRLRLGDVVVPTAQNWVALGVGEFPSHVIAVANTVKGAVVSQLVGAIGAHSLAENAGSNNVQPRNLIAVFDGATGDQITSSGRVVWALLQVGNLATDGNAFAATGNDQGQLSFVRPNATFDDLEACPVADVENKTFVYAYTQRNDMGSFEEIAYRGDISGADPGSGGVTVSLDSAYDGGEFMNVDGSDVDIRLADTKSWVVRKGTGGVVLWQIKRTDAGTADEITIGSNVDIFNNDAAANDFAQGLDVDTADQKIGVGTAGVGVIDSASLEVRATTGNAEISAASGDVQFQTVRETTALPLDDATAGKVSALAGGPHASISAAIAYAMTVGGADFTVKIFVAASNYAQDVNVPAASLDLSVFSIDMNTPSGVSALVFLNGRLLHGGNVTTQNDVYVGTTPANGDLKFDFTKGIKSGDVLITVGLKA